VIDNTRAAEKESEGRPLAIALDTKGPEIRTGNTVGDQDIPVSAGHEMLITTDEQCFPRMN
jgi:pyruvate kinase